MAIVTGNAFRTRLGRRVLTSLYSCPNVLVAHACLTHAKQARSPSRLANHRARLATNVNTWITRPISEESQSCDMTTISFSGGPTIEQRRTFSNLKDGSHVPGYGGYCPHLKYRMGNTYGKDTRELATKHNSYLTVDYLQQNPRINLKNSLPVSTGDNKYTREMVPGYTGYIPRMPFKFGDTYQVDCNVCIDEHLTNSKRNSDKMQSLLEKSCSYPPLNPINTDPDIRDHMNTYRDTHPRQPVLMGERRGKCEPPLPGYLGYIPRIYTTETGLGCRYNKMTRQGLAMFAKETADHQKALGKHVNPLPQECEQQVRCTNQRIYLKDGMVPNYTGYVPRRRYDFGHTYGDTTRSLEVCSHKLDCYGDYTQGKTTVTHSIL